MLDYQDGTSKLQDLMPIPKTIFDSAAVLFSIKDAQIEPLHGGHFSHVYGFTQDSRSYVLQITPPSAEIIFEEMRAILEWIGTTNQ